MEYTILATAWRSALHTVGFIAYECDEHLPKEERRWNSVVGYFRPSMFQSPVDITEEDEAQYIAAHGAKIEPEIAHLLFPYLDITKHKYYSPSDTTTDVPS